MRSSRFLLVVGVAAARAVVTLILALGFWAAAPVALGWHPTTVMTASMAPAIDVGDVVVARPLPHDALLTGRVVLATDPDRTDRLRLHRIVDLAPDGDLVTKGDANPAADSSPLHPDAVLGVGVLRVPWIGMPIVWLRTGEVVPLAAVAAAFALCLVVALRKGDDDDHPPPSRRSRRTGRVPTPAGATAAPPPRGASPPAPAPGASPSPLATSPDPADDAAAAGPSPDTGDGAERRPPPPTRRARRALGLATAVALALGAAATPSWATLADASAAPAGITAGRVSPPSGLQCRSDFFGAVVSWSYDGWDPRGFDLLVNGRVVLTDIPANARSARVPADGSFSISRTDRVTVRANVGARWSADSAASVPVGGVLFGFGRPYCRPE